MDHLKNLGMLLVLFGAGSFGLNMIGYEFSLLMWIDNWGATTGNGIRIGMTVLGAVLLFVGWKAGQGAEDAPAEVDGSTEAPAKPEREAA